MTETTHGNFNARLTVFIFAWNMNLKSFWLEAVAELDIFIDSKINSFDWLIEFFLSRGFLVSKNI